MKNWETKERVLILVILIIIGLLINSVFPATSATKNTHISTSVKQAPKKILCQKSDDNFLSGIIGENKNKKPCTFVGCGTLF